MRVSNTEILISPKVYNLFAKALFWLLSVFTIASLLTSSSYINTPLAALWFIFCLRFVIKGILYWVKIFQKIVLQKKWLTGATIATGIIFLIYEALRVENCNFEATQQIGGTIKLLLEKSSFGITNTVFIDYPSRQFWIQSWPTLLFGPSCAALNSGFLILIFSGLGYFLHGLIEYLNRKCSQMETHQGFTSDYLIAFSLGLLLHLNAVVYSILTFEQTAIPTILLLALIGEILRSLKTNDSELGFIFIFALFSYTPALAISGLILFWMTLQLYKAFQNKSATTSKTTSTSLSSYLVFITLLLMFAINLYRPDVRSGDYLKNVNLLIADLPKIFDSLFFISEGHWFISPIFWLTLVVSILASLRLQRSDLGKKSWLILWGLATIAAALYMSGYYRSSVAARVIRGSSGFLALWLFTVVLLVNFRESFNRYLNAYRKPAYLFLIIIFMTGVAYTNWNIQQKIYLRQLTPIYFFVRTAQAQVPLFEKIKDLEKTGYAISSIVISPTLKKIDGANRLEDGTLYFFPKASTFEKHLECSDIEPGLIYLTTPNFICDESLWKTIPIKRNNMSDAHIVYFRNDLI